MRKPGTACERPGSRTRPPAEPGLTPDGGGMTPGRQPAREGTQTTSIPSGLPSWHLDSALRVLRMDGTIPEDKVKAMKDRADRFQRAHCPGKPSVTMAACLWLGCPPRRYLHEIARAFDCSKEALSRRIDQVKEATQ